MSMIFHIYTFQEPNRYAELDLPASDYEILDLMERLRLGPGQLPYVEILRFREEYDYLETCIQELPDIYQLNALAGKLAKFASVQEMAAFEGLVSREIQNGAVPIQLPKLIDFACSTDCCYVAEDAVSDVQLGKFLVDNELIAEVNGLPDYALALLDYGKLGMEHRMTEDGIYTGFGYVEQHSQMHHVSETMDFQPKRPAYTVLLNMAPLPFIRKIEPEDMIQLRLPAPAEQLQDALDKMGVGDWDDVTASIQDCAVPGLIHELYLNGEIPRIMELAQRLSELEGQGKLIKYKAILAANGCNHLPRMIDLAGKVDAYILEPQISSPEDAARGELDIILCNQNAKELMPYIDLIGYGRALLKRDQAIITPYGLLEQNREHQIQDMGQDAAPQGMVMG